MERKAGILEKEVGPRRRNVPINNFTRQMRVFRMQKGCWKAVLNRKMRENDSRCRDDASIALSDCDSSRKNSYGGL
jgi:hypothetical protein